MVATESDPQRLYELVDQIVTALDAQEMRHRKDGPRLGRPPNADGAL